MAGSRLPKPFTPPELRALFDAARDRPEITATMTLLLETGLRSAEALSITRTEAQGWHRPRWWCALRCRARVTLRIVGKGAGGMHSGGGKERVVPLSREALRAAVALLGASGRNGRADYLIPWSDRGLRYVLAGVGTSAGVHVHPHRFRTTAATEWVDAGVDPYVVADLLGHDDLGTTRVYTLLSSRRKFEALRSRARWRRRYG